MKLEHEPGRCDACLKDTQVRWKNLYTKGSEGTWLCMPCEKTVCNLINSMGLEAALDKKRRIIDSKIKQGTKPSNIIWHNRTKPPGGNN